ncbi:efflux RND transporter permease subunit [Metabacillus arenae]|uniref:Efflux RND transporter permease subunit n=1 Tax=Metabacillus arenae TaxID=2771434 RepID=A0A926NT13_9BACI|nr:efflux RND transporter permease subunit [Metabacillus arenae]MBD1383391.1 efflux RND transporter permease subunit [Metabacillus arenae]
MSIFTKFSLKNRAAVIIMVFLVTILGAYSSTRLPMELLPSVDNPMITVSTFGQGMDAETMTEEVTTPLESELKNVTHLDVITSSTSEGFSQIDLMYTSEAEMKEAAREVEKLVNQIQLPQGMMKPIVSQLNTSMIPIAQIAIESDKGFTSNDEKVIDQEIMQQFEDIDGVSSISLYGKSSAELAVTLNADQMKEKKVSAQQVMMSLQSQNASIPAGEISIEGSSNAVRVLGEVEDISQIENISLNQETKLKDIGDVKVEQFYEAESRLNGNPSLILVIMKEANANAVDIGKKLVEKTKEINDQYTEQYDVRVITNTGEDVENAVLGMAKEVGLGAVAATIILLFFLRSFKTTIIAVISIPLSILITLFLLDLSNITLNILTLGGLAVAVGRLVDDSIVVIENIYRRIQGEGMSKEVVISATKEVAGAITSSTLTTIAVFLPIGLISGGIGEFTIPLVLAVVYSILGSLLVALTVVPLMSFVLLKKIKQKETRAPRKYLSILGWSLNHKWIILVASFLIFVGSIFAFAAIPQANVNSEDESYLNVVMSFPADYDPVLAKEKAAELEKQLITEDKVIDTFFRMGTATEDAKYGTAAKGNEATIGMIFEKGKNVKEFIEKLKKDSKKYAPAELEASLFSFGSFGGGSNTELNVTAANQEDLVEAGAIVLAELKKIDGLEKVKSNYEELKKEWVVNVEQEKASKFGLSPNQVGQEVHSYLNKTLAGEMTIEDEKLQAVLKFEKDEYKEENELLDLYVSSPAAGPVRLGEVAAINEEEIKTQIYHKKGKETIKMTAVIVAEDIRAVGNDINKMIAGVELPAGANVELAGATESMQESFMDLFKIMGIAIFIVYLIMVITFGQAKAPFAILFSLPLAAVGGIAGLIVTRTPVDINALIGALMLIGIVVTNAIVLVERVQQNREKGMDTREALLEAGGTRLRPIIMTAVTTIVAMLPLLFGTAEAGSVVSKSLAVVVIGGLTVSTILTLVVVPVVYELLDRLGKRRKKVKKENPELSI